MADNSMKSDVKSMLGIQRIMLMQEMSDFTAYILNSRGFVSTVRANLLYKVDTYPDKDKDIAFLEKTLINIGEILENHKKGTMGGEEWKKQINIIDSALNEVDCITCKNDMCNYTVKADGVI
ncbi:MAG: hypothetical protein M0R51_11970 [Clostridia bacterium]|jgi:hypothetical protein|nr:hypothetical protein [Clostridia bacterium]